MKSLSASILALRPGGQVVLPETQMDFGPLDVNKVQEVQRELESVEYVPDELILGLDASLLESEQDIAEVMGGAVVERFDSGDSVNTAAPEVIRLKLAHDTDLAKALVSVRELPGVAFAEANQVIRLQDEVSVPEDPSLLHQNQDPPHIPDDLSAQLWGLHNTQNQGADISALEAWKVTTGSPNGPMIAVLDSGADYTHPDLQANIALNPGEIPGDGVDNDGNGVVDDVFGFNAFENHGDPMDGMGHGTHCTGTIAAVGDNSQGIVGVNWQAQVLPVKIFHDRGLTTTDAILRGIAYSKKRGAFITSNSWGGGPYSQAIRDAFAGNQALNIAAAGNSASNNDSKPSYPADYEIPNMISVGASNSSDNPSWFSNIGRKSVDLFAPGEDIVSTLPGGAFGAKSGTSMATPHVAGVAGLVSTALPSLEIPEVRDRLLYGTDPITGVADISVTGGRLNAARALSTDDTPPASPNDFWVTGSSPRQVQFSWTGTGDDGWKNGAATAFEIRVSEQPLTADNWNSASLLSTPRGKEVGDHLHAFYSQNPQSHATPLYAGFQAIDEVGNRSELVTTETLIPASPTVFRDDFDSQETQWIADGRWKLVHQEGRGQVWSSKGGVQSKAGAFSDLQSPEIDLSETHGSFLRFESRQDFAWSNNVFLEISTNQGEEWQRLDTLEDRGQWNTHEYDLSAYDGRSVSLRIRSENLGAKEEDGVMLDKLEILGEPNHPHLLS